MKKIFSVILTLAMLCGTVLGLVSCGDAPVGGGAQINVYLGGEVYDFDPQGEYTDDAALGVIRMLFEPLFYLDEDGELVNGMAESYDVDKDTHIITIEIRESYWSDQSTPVKASDFIYAWQRLIRCGNSNPAAALLYDVKNAVAIKQGNMTVDALGVSAKDNKTLMIELEDGASATSFLRNLASLALSPLNSNAVGGREEYWSKRLLTVSTNGAFRISEYDLEAGVFTIERNEGYHQTPMALELKAESDKIPDGIDAEGKAEKAEKLEKLENKLYKKIDDSVVPYILRTVWNVEDESGITDEAYLNLLLDNLAKKTLFVTGEIPCDKRAEYKSKAVVNDTLSTYSYIFNTNNELFDDPAVRLALESVIDREHIISLITFGKPATGLVTRGVANGTKLKLKSDFRTKGGKLLSTTATATIEQAKAALTAASATFGEFTLTYRNTEENNLIASYVKSLWDQLGYTVVLNPVKGELRGFADGGAKENNLDVTDSALQYAYETGNFDVIGIDFQMYSTEPLAAFTPFTSRLNGNGIDVGGADGGISVDGDGNSTATYDILGNVFGYASEAYDAKVEAALAERNPSKRAALLHEAEELLLADMPIIPLVFNQSYYVVSKQLDEISVDWFGRISLTKAELKDYEKYLPKEEE